MFPDYQLTRHSEKLAEVLEGVTFGRIKRLIISMPPRHGKSLHSSVYFPAWHLGMFPNDRIIACSYSSELSHAFSRQARNLVMSPEYAEVFGNPNVYDQVVEMSSDSRSQATWDLASPFKGGYVSAGVGGSITGKGANVLIIDDYVKDWVEASSPTTLESVWNWYTSTAYSRLEGESAAVIIIATRWSEDDLIGRVMRQAEEKGRLDEWTVLRLPGLAEEDDPLGRAEGEALWPEKFSRDFVLDQQFTMPPQQFAALIQQRPAPLEGLYIKKAWLKYYDPRVMPTFRRVIQCWDTAFKEKQENDYSVCTTWGMAQRVISAEEKAMLGIKKTRAHDLYLLDCYRKKLQFPDLTREMIAQYHKWSSVPGCRPTEILVEDKATGTPAYQSLRHATDLPLRAFQTQRDKVLRMNAITPWYEQGRIYHPSNAAWLDEYEHELMTFPGTKHDDQVDSTTMAIERLLGPAGATAFLNYMRDQSRQKEQEKTEIALPAGIQVAEAV